MYNQIASSYPAAGKTPELRAIVEAQVRDRQRRGLRASLSATAWGPDFPAFHLVLQYPDLAALQKARSEIAASTQDFQKRQAPFVRATNEVDLLEVLVAPNGTTGAGGFRQRNVLTAAAGKAQALRTLLTDWATGEQARGSRMSLLTAVAGTQGTFVLNRQFDNLLEFEKWRAARGDAARQEFFAKRDELVAFPGTISVLENIVPFPG